MNIEKELRNNVLNQLDTLMEIINNHESEEEIQRALGVLHYMYERLTDYQRSN